MSAFVVASALTLAMVLVVNKAQALHVRDYEDAPPLETMLPDGTTRRMSHTVRATTKEGKFLDFKMEVELDTTRFRLVNLHAFRGAEHVTVVKHNNDHHLRVVGGAALHQHLLTGEPHLNATTYPNVTNVLYGQSATGTMLLHGVKHHSLEDAAVLAMVTSPMEYHQVFRKANIVLHTSHLVYEYVPRVAPGSTALKNLRQHRTVSAAALVSAPQQQSEHTTPSVGWGWNPLSDAVQLYHETVPLVAGVVTHIIAPVFHGLVDLATGSLDGGDTLEVLKNTMLASGSTSSSGNSDGSFLIHRPAFTDGDVTVTAEADFELSLLCFIEVSDYTLQNLTMVVEGSLDAQVKGVFQTSGNASYNHDETVGTFQFDSIKFDVGIPVIITPSVPLHLGATINIFGELTIQVAASAAGDLQVGFTYTDGNGFSPIVRKSLQYKMPLPNASVTVDAAATFYIMPVLITNADYFGGPFVSLKAAAQAMFKAYVDTNGKSQFQLDGSLLLVGSVGAKVGIHSEVISFDRTFGPATVYNQNIPLICYDSNSQGGSSSSASGSSSSQGGGSSSSQGGGSSSSQGGDSSSSQGGGSSSSQGGGSSSSQGAGDRRWPLRSANCPMPEGGFPPTTAYIGQSLHGELALEENNRLGLLSGSVTMQTTYVEGSPGSAVNVTFACTLSASYAGNVSVQYFSQQAYCYLWDTGVQDQIAFSLSGNAALNYASGTELSTIPVFDFGFVGKVGSSCDVSEFVLRAPGIGTMVITGA